MTRFVNSSKIPQIILNKFLICIQRISPNINEQQPTWFMHRKATRSNLYRFAIRIVMAGHLRRVSRRECASAALSLASFLARTSDVAPKPMRRTRFSSCRGIVHLPIFVIVRHSGIRPTRKILCCAIETANTHT